MTSVPAADRYERMPYRRSRRSGLLLPAVALGLWQNFGADRPLETSRAIVRRGQTLAQLAIAWTLRDPRVTSTLTGASSVAQLEADLGALGGLGFSAEELAEIDLHATDDGIDIWAESSTA